jgi:hypothetical protein
MADMITYIDREGRLRVDVYQNGQLMQSTYAVGSAVIGWTGTFEEAYEWSNNNFQNVHHLVGFKVQPNNPDQPPDDDDAA